MTSATLRTAHRANPHRAAAATTDDFGLAATLLPGDSVIVTTIAILGFLVYLFAGVTIAILRSHDMDLSGWWSIAAMIPLVMPTSTASLPDRTQ